MYNQAVARTKKAVNLLNGLTASSDSQNKNVTNTSHLANPQNQHSTKVLKSLVGARGFEPPTP